MDKALIQKALIDQIHCVTKDSRLRRLLEDPLKPIYRRLLESFTRFFDRLLPVRVKTFWGGTMQIVLPERSSSYILKFGFWEEDVSTMLLENLTPGAIFFDIGAHIGYFSLLANAIIGKTGQVHAFEPSPWAFAVLKTNTRTIQHCVLNDVAVFSEEKFLEFQDYGAVDSLYNSFFSIDQSEPIERELKARRYTVPTRTLDSYCDQKNILPDVVKIDAETAEYEILKGMEMTIDRKKPIFIFEIGGFGRDNTSSDQDAVAYLLNKGYTPFEFQEGNIIKYDLKKEHHYKNLLFLP